MPQIKLDVQNPESLKMTHLYDPQKTVKFICSEKKKSYVAYLAYFKCIQCANELL